MASHPAPPAQVPALATVAPLDSLTLRLAELLDLCTLGLPPYLVPPPAGSTPRWQWQRTQTQNLARAGMLPAKIKNSSVATAPSASAVNRASAPVATGSGAATDNRKAGQRGGASASAVGPGALATATRSGGASWWWYLVAALAGAVGWEFISTRPALLKWLLWRGLPH